MINGLAVFLLERHRENVGNLKLSHLRGLLSGERANAKGESVVICHYDDDT